MKNKHLIFPTLLLLLTAVLIIGFVNQTQQTNKKEAAKNLVLDAVSLIEYKGENAFVDFRQQDTEWFSGDTYVFVWKTNGIRAVYPPDPNGEGQNMSTLVDYDGKPIGKLFIDTALSTEGEGWVDYSWPKPQETQPSTKQTYIKKATINEQTFLVGSGFYLDTAQNTLNPLQYIAIILETVVAATGLLIAVHKKRFFGYGIFLTFAIYVFYDLAKLIPLEISDTTLYPIFFVATLSILWTTILIYKEK